MAIQITIELIPQGDEMQKRRVAIANVSNDGTGTAELGNYTIRAGGLCVANGQPVGWDTFEGQPQRVEGIERQRGHLHLAAVALAAVCGCGEDGHGQRRNKP